MKKFTLALCAATTLLLSACQTNTLYSHRKDFSPKGHGGPWHTEYQKLDRGDTKAEREAAHGNSRRPLWRPGKWHEYHWL